jgi:hypothetical protein
LKYQQQLSDNNIKYGFDEYEFFHAEYLVIRFHSYFSIDKNIVAKRTWRFITTYFYYPVFTINVTGLRWHEPIIIQAGKESSRQTRSHQTNRSRITRSLVAQKKTPNSLLWQQQLR